MTTPCRSVIVVLGLLLLVACAVPDKSPPPPPATPARMAKEQQHLQQSFFSDPCMARLRQAAPELRAGATQEGGRTLYAVEFPPNSAVRDGRAYQLHVKEQGRLAYFYVGDGTAGSYRIHGPLPLWRCLQERLP
ncbi:MAG: hypothetical protein VW475_12110 [Curvibacter sp.]